MNATIKLLLTQICTIVGWGTYGIGINKSPHILGILFAIIGFSVGMFGSIYSYKVNKEFFAKLWKWRFKEKWVPKEASS